MTLPDVLTRKTTRYNRNVVELTYSQGTDELRITTQFVEGNKDLKNNYFVQDAQRKLGVDPAQRLDQLESGEPFVVAGGYGTSSELVYNINGKWYLSGVSRSTVEFGENVDVIKYISGTVPQEDQCRPDLCALNEVCEEALAVKDRQISPYLVSGLIHATPHTETVTYASQGIPLSHENWSVAQGLIGAGGIFVNGIRLPGNPRFYLHARLSEPSEAGMDNGMDGGQIVFPHSADLTGLEGLTLVHTEDKFTIREDDEGKIHYDLNVVRRPLGSIVLNRLEGSHPTDEWYVLDQGELKPLDEFRDNSVQIHGSEVWAVKNGVVSRNHIPWEVALSRF